MSTVVSVCAFLYMDFSRIAGDCISYPIRMPEWRPLQLEWHKRQMLERAQMEAERKEQDQRCKARDEELRRREEEVFRAHTRWGWGARGDYWDGCANHMRGA